MVWTVAVYIVSVTDDSSASRGLGGATGAGAGEGVLDTCALGVPKEENREEKKLAPVVTGFVEVGRTCRGAGFSEPMV